MNYIAVMPESPIEKIDQKYPEPAAVVLVFNAHDEVLLVKDAGVADVWTLPSGHVEVEETVEQAAVRELAEETGLQIMDLEFITWHDALRPGLKRNNKHLVFFLFAAKCVPGEVRLQDDELSEYLWITPEKALAELTLEPRIIKNIQAYLENRKSLADAKQCAEYKHSWQRALADYQNLQKETAARRAEWASMSEQQIVEEFIPVYDNFKKAFGVKEQGAWSKEPSFAEATAGRQDSWVRGIEYIKKQFSDVLKNHGVEEIKTVGQKFDPQFHEAVGEESADGHEAGSIVKEIDGGYTMAGRVIKVAKVIIAK